MNSDIKKYLNVGTGFLLLGLLWLLFWVGPAYSLFVEDSRWGHNYTIPLLFILVGIAYYSKKNTCLLIAAVVSYLTIPTFLGFLSWYVATIIALVFIGLYLLFCILERNRKNELLQVNKRLDRWMKIHMLTFAYIGLVHMPLIFFVVRWFHPQPFLIYLPIEHHASTSLFNLLLIPFSVIAIMERFVKKIGPIYITFIGFLWSILMIIIPLLAIAIVGE